MKKAVLLTSAALLVLGTQASAQQATGVIKTNPLGMAFGNFNAKYEHVLSAKSSVSVGASFFTKILGTDVSGFGVNTDYRYYITHKKLEAPEGFYLGPNISFNFGKEKNTNFSYPLLGIGANLGYQIVWDSGFVLDIGMGPQYVFATAVDESSSISGGGVIPNFTLGIGYAFGK